jgi:hypothetical protein
MRKRMDSGDNARMNAPFSARAGGLRAAGRQDSIAKLLQ